MSNKKIVEEIINKMKFPKIVSKRETKKLGMIYSIDHITNKIVNRPINFVLFVSLNKFLKLDHNYPVF